MATSQVETVSTGADKAKLGAAIALVLAAVPFAGWCAGKSYQSDSLNPRHLQELRMSINQCSAQVQNAPDAATKSKYQEQLCKKLIQAQDYDAALQVASDVAQSQGADPERRAAHHFMIAQIYALKMEASPSADLMQQNRTKALLAIRDQAGRRRVQHGR